MYQYFMDSPIGRLRLVESDGFIKEISRADVPAARLDSEGKIIKTAETFESAVTEKTEALAETEQQLREYFAGIRKSFDVLLKPDGTAFFSKCLESAVGYSLRRDTYLWRYREGCWKTESGQSCGDGKSLQSNHDYHSVPSCHRRQWTVGRVCRWSGCKASSA